MRETAAKLTQIPEGFFRTYRETVLNSLIAVIYVLVGLKLAHGHLQASAEPGFARPPADSLGAPSPDLPCRTFSGKEAMEKHAT